MTLSQRYAENDQGRARSMAGKESFSQKQVSQDGAEYRHQMHVDACPGWTDQRHTAIPAKICDHRGTLAHIQHTGENLRVPVDSGNRVSKYGR